MLQLIGAGSGGPGRNSGGGGGGNDHALGECKVKARTGPSKKALAAVARALGICRQGRLLVRPQRTAGWYCSLRIGFIRNNWAISRPLAAQ